MAREFTKVERNILQDDEYELLSQWTSSQSVEMDDGNTLETKMESVDTNISNEIARAKEAESTLTTNLNNEITRAKNAEALKAPLASPALTGTPTAPTATAGTNTTQIATTSFVQTAISNLVNSAPETLDTLGELADAIEEHQDVTDALDAAISNKVDKVDGKGLSTNDYTTAEKTKLSGIATGAEVNQNAFSNVIVGSTTIVADSKTDSLTFVAGNNITITPDATNDKMTIAVSSTSSTGVADSADFDFGEI